MKKLYAKKAAVMMVALCVTATVWGMSSQAASRKDVSQASFNVWIDDFKQEAQAEGISKETLSQALAEVTLQERAIKLDKRQPYKTKTLDQYLTLVAPQSRIQKAQRLYQEHKEELDAVAKAYGVQARFIVALWGIESSFGQNTGGFPIIDSLATMAYEGRRETFFKKELIHALRILDEGHIAHADMKGSWAGAMGQTQFMPSSFRAYAVDHNQDGKKDIWQDKRDVFASIANYLKNTNWDNTTTWGRVVTLPDDFDPALVDIKISKSLSEWQVLGVRQINGSDLSSRHLKASLIQPEDDGASYFLVYDNFKRILKWNRSLYFATGVGVLSDSIG